MYSELQKVSHVNEIISKYQIILTLQAGVRVRILGNLSYLPADLRETVREVERVTEANSESLLNIALSYTAR